MRIKSVVSLLLGASLCLPLLGCGAGNRAEKPIQTVHTGPAVTVKPEQAPSIPQEVPATEESVPAETKPEPKDEDLVAVREYIPEILVEMKYASADNFTGQAIYDFQEPYLRYGTVKKLMAAQLDFGEIGLSIKIWDSFRPVSAQFKLWEVCPDDTYVADPRKGYSNHSRGNAVDLTLVDKEGRELEMPTAFDDFSAMADRDYSDCPPAAAENAMLLQTVMERHGFKGYFGEWWHFADEVRYPVEETFHP